MPIKTLSIFGTRPEAIKMAPLLRLLEADERFNSKICVTGQHKEMLSPILDFFGIIPDFDLAVMSHNQSLTRLAFSIIEGLSPIIEQFMPDVILVHGDTTTTASSSLAAFYSRIPLAHIEAGLRTGDIESPWPEEANRRVVSLLSSSHFCPTHDSRINLLNENVAPKTIFVTGNTVVDALLSIIDKIKGDLTLKKDLKEKFPFIENDKKNVLITCHRRENYGDGIEEICSAIKELSFRFNSLNFIYPVHLNPNIRGPVNRMLSGIENIYLIPPQEYLNFVYLMSKAHLIITDSGGIQEEAPTLGRPVMLIRDKTERPEAIEAGVVRLVGTKKDQIINGAVEILENNEIYASMTNRSNPYGDGTASLKIVNALAEIYKDEI